MTLHSSALWRKRAQLNRIEPPDLGSGSILEQSAFGAAHLTKHGVIVSSTRSLRHLLGYEQRFVIGKNLFHYLHADDTVTVQQALHAIADGASRSAQLTCRVLNLSGDWRLLEATLGPVSFADFEIPTAADIIVNFVDITERQRAFLRAGERERALEHMVRLHSLGELAAALSHELMQPFAAITNYVGGSITRLQRPKRDMPAILAALKAAGAEAERAGQIMARMRQFMARHEPTTTLIDAREVVRTIREFIRLKAERAGCRFEVREPGGDGFDVHGDPVLLGQVILNMAFNGIESMDETSLEQRLLIIATDRLPNAVRITIEDRGCGLPDVNPDRLFESFFTTKRGGSGIGLSLCRTIVEAYGGHIWIARLPKGSRFHVSLPYAQRLDC